MWIAPTRYQATTFDLVHEADHRRPIDPQPRAKRDLRQWLMLQRGENTDISRLKIERGERCINVFHHSSPCLEQEEAHVLARGDSFYPL